MAFQIQNTPEIKRNPKSYILLKCFSVDIFHNLHTAVLLIFFTDNNLRFQSSLNMSSCVKSFYEVLKVPEFFLCHFLIVELQFVFFILLSYPDRTAAHKDVCFLQVDEGLICSEPRNGLVVTYSECCCHYGRGWGPECNTCPPRNSGNRTRPHMQLSFQVRSFKALLSYAHYLQCRYGNEKLKSQAPTVQHEYL